MPELFLGAHRRGRAVRAMVLGLAVVVGPLAVAGCRRSEKEVKPARLSAARLGEPLWIGVAPFRTGGFPSNAECMAGNYSHAYTMASGPHAGDVWLCCVPVEELLRDSFSCADGALVLGRLGLGTAADLKVQHCNLYDATSTELRYTPACIPAPLQAPPGREVG